MSGGNLVATSTFTSPAVTLPSILTQKGQLLGTNGVGGNLVAVNIGTNGSPVIYDSTQSDGLGSTLANNVFNLGAPTGWTGGNVTMTARRIGTICIANIPSGTITNTSGGNSAFDRTVTGLGAFAAASTNRFAVQASVSGVPQLVMLEVVGLGGGSMRYVVYPTNSGGAGFTWANGTSINLLENGITFECTG